MAVAPRWVSKSASAMLSMEMGTFVSDLEEPGPESCQAQGYHRIALCTFSVLSLKTSLVEFFFL